jgi:hypothetical protein
MDSLKLLVIWRYRSTKEADMTTAVAARTLNALDRCDRCGAQAYVRVVLESSGGELLFCGHHSRAVEATLKPLSSDWHDETGRLHEKTPVEID